jgi:predicted nucleic acid-binding protein
MIVVSDTSPLNYLVLTELQEVLPKLFDQILIPEGVHRELRDPRAPDAVRRFMASPGWRSALSRTSILPFVISILANVK